MRVILVFVLSLMALPTWANQLKSVRVWPSPDNTRVVLDMSSAPNFNYFTLTGPNRLVIDLKGASNATNLARIENKSELVRKIRESTPLEQGSLRLVLDPAGEHRLADLPRPASARAWIAIGPEGGWSPADRGLLHAAGFSGLRLGPRVLRTETAGLAAIAALQSRFGDL